MSLALPPADLRPPGGRATLAAALHGGGPV